jgi:hypothetical protein
MADRHQADQDRAVLATAHRPDRYFKLLDLVAAWTDEARQPRTIVLKNLCDWMMAGAFPDGSVLTATKEPINAVRMYFAGRAAISSDGIVRVGQFFKEHLGDSTIQNLLQVIVSESGLRVFCQTTSTDLPRNLRHWSIWPRRRATATHPAPPPCPGVERRVVELIGAREARVFMRGLHLMLEEARSGLKGGDTPVEDVVTYFERRWASHREWAGRFQSELADPKLDAELATLDAQREAILASANRRVDHIEEEPPVRAPAIVQVRPSPMSAALMTSPTRTKHYPQERVDVWYKGRVERLLAEGMDSDLMADWAAAKVGGFPDISRDCIRAIRKRLAPEEWKRKGRRRKNAPAHLILPPQIPAVAQTH